MAPYELVKAPPRGYFRVVHSHTRVIMGGIYTRHDGRYGASVSGEEADLGVYDTAEAAAQAATDAFPTSRSAILGIADKLPDTTDCAQPRGTRAQGSPA